MIRDRLVHDAYRLELKGASMRKRRGGRAADADRDDGVGSAGDPERSEAALRADRKKAKR